jgi:F0F1-type ATP synthase membrane subunit b/b'
MLEREEQLKKLERADKHYDEKMKLAEKERKEMVDNARKTSRSLMKESEIVARAKSDAIMAKAHDDALSVLDG